MEEWQNEISAAFKDLSLMLEGFGREITELVEEVSAEAQEILNLQWDEIKETLVVIWQDVETDFQEPTLFDWDLPPQTQPQPDPLTHPACVGCVNYHGSAFGGNLLVCGMHPYGCGSDVCSDWDDGTKVE